MKLRWTLRANRELIDIGRYIAQDKPSAARGWVERLRQRAKKAAALPMVGRKVPEIDRQDVRKVLVRNYRIVYRILADEIHILSVFESHKQLSRSVVDTLD